MSQVSAWEEQGNRHVDLGAAPLAKAHHRVLARLALELGGERARVLDLGCGLGQVSELLARSRPGWELHAADAYEECLARTAARVPLAGRHRLDEQRFALDGLPRELDLVVMSHVLEHMLDPVGALRATLTLLRPGGHLLLAVPNPVRPSVIVASCLRRDYVNRGHVVAWDRAHWMNFLERILGLEVVRYASDTVPVFPERWKRSTGSVGRCLGRAEERLAGLLPWLAFSHIAVVRRPSLP